MPGPGLAAPAQSIGIIGPRPPFPPRSDEIVLWSREIQIPKSGVIRATASFPKNAESANIQVNPLRLCINF